MDKHYHTLPVEEWEKINKELQNYRNKGRYSLSVFDSYFSHQRYEIFELHLATPKELEEELVSRINLIIEEKNRNIEERIVNVTDREREIREWESKSFFYKLFNPLKP